MPHDSYLSNPRYKNWVKGGLATKFLREGIVDLVDQTTERQHNAMLGDIKRAYGDGVVDGCKACSLKTLMPIHTKNNQGTCSLGQKQHCNCLNPKGKQLCPTKFCSAMYDKIIAQHRFRSPSWKNTDIRQWHNNHWQIAICNIPTGESSGKMSAADTDCSGLINVMINNLELQTNLSCVIDPPRDVISKARIARNEIFHSTDLELDDHTVRTYINDMISILDDRICRSYATAEITKTKLEQLRDDTREITIADEMEIRKASLNAMTEKGNEILENLETRKNEIISDLNSILQRINDQCTSFSTRKEYEELTSLVESIDTKLQKVKHEGEDQDTLIETIQSQVNSLNDKVVTMEDFPNQIQILSDQLEKLKKPISSSSGITEMTLQSTEWAECMGNTAKIAVQLNQELQDVRQELFSFRRNILIHNQRQEEHEKQLAFLSKRKALQADLIEMYLKYKTKASVVPTRPEEETDVADIYEKPDMVVVDSQLKTSEYKGTPMKSYKELFCLGDRRNIYVSGDAGMGKSTFCKHLIQQWCEVHEESGRPSVHIFENREVLRAFEYLFYVSLCHMTHEYHVHQMVKRHPLTSSLNKELFDTIVETESERCLIILDGLDEWNPKGVDEDTFLRESKIPQRDLMKKYTILTTTRPWKMEEAKLKTTDIDIHAKVHGLTDMSSNQFIGSVVHYLNVKYGRCKNDSDFLKLLAFQRLSDMKSVPVVLLQLICLWHDGKPLGDSLCDTYSNMIDLFFEVSKFELDVQETCSQKLPLCFRYNKNCQRYEKLIFKLAEFSYKTLFPEDQMSTLVFDRSVAHDCGMTPEDIDLGLKIGLLTESKIASASERLTSLSFLHKTFQEFLAAVFISTSLPSHETKHDVISTLCNKSYATIENQLFKTCSSIPDILEMRNIFIFVSGMNPTVAKQLSKRIHMIVGENDDVKRYRKDLCKGELKQSQHIDVFSELKQVCNLITCCIEEILNAKNKLDLPVEIDCCMYLSDLICDHEDSFQPRWKESQLRSMLCIDAKYVKSVYIRGNCFVLETLLDFASKCLSLDKLEIQDLIYDRDIVKIKFASCLLKLGYDLITRSRNSLVQSSWELGMNGNSLQLLFEEPLERNKPSSMKVEICHIPYRHSDLKNILVTLPLLTEVTLVDTYCSNHKLGTCPLHLQLGYHQKLQTLVLEHLFLEKVDIPTSFLDLQYLKLNNVEFCHDDLEKIVSGLESAEQLREIHLQRIQCVDHDVGKCTFLLHLTGHRDLQHVDLQYVPFHFIVNQPSLKYCCSWEFNIEAKFLEGLAHCNSLQILTLSQSRMTPLSPQTVRAMIEIIPNFSQIEKLELQFIHFCYETPRLSNEMKKLKYVVLRNCTLTSDAFQQFLASAPKVKHKLKIFVLFTRIEERELLQDRERIYDLYAKQANLLCTSSAVFDSYINYRFEN